MFVRVSGCLAALIPISNIRTDVALFLIIKIWFILLHDSSNLLSIKPRRLEEGRRNRNINLRSAFNNARIILWLRTEYYELKNLKCIELFNKSYICLYCVSKFIYNKMNRLLIVGKSFLLCFITIESEAYLYLRPFWLYRGTLMNPKYNFLSLDDSSFTLNDTHVYLKIRSPL